MKIPTCYGKRAEAYDKCETCELIVACSIISLESVTDEKVQIIPHNYYESEL